jgi:hypothetical protein
MGNFRVTSVPASGPGSTPESTEIAHFREIDLEPLTLGASRPGWSSTPLPDWPATRIPQDDALVAFADLGSHYQISIHPANLKSRH